MVAARIYLVRHGETEANRREIVQGQLDTHLNKSGIEQAALVSEELQKIPFDEGYSSDLSRASKVIPCLALGANTDLGSLDGGNDPEKPSSCPTL